MNRADEFGDVAQAINSAFDTLDAQYEEIRKLATVAEGSRTGVVITTPDGVIEWVNPSFTRISGYALERLCQSTRAYSGAVVALRTDARLPQLDAWQADHLYLIAQEALRNAIRHGAPSRIHVNLACHDRALVLRVTSHQRPWDASSREDGLGLRIMRHRAETMNATLSIRVRPQGITQVKLMVPLDGSIALRDAAGSPA